MNFLTYFLQKNFFPAGTLSYRYCISQKVKNSRRTNFTSTFLFLHNIIEKMKSKFENCEKEAAYSVKIYLTFIYPRRIILMSRSFPPPMGELSAREKYQIFQQIWGEIPPSVQRYTI
jgi:hypothetical protein